MKLKLSSFFIVLLIVITSCKSSQTVSNGKEAYTPLMQKIMAGYPDIIGFERRVIFPEKLSPSLEKEQKIEIFPGREILVDCNQYGLQGQMLSRTFSNGNSYYLFNTNGEIYSTKMACSDETRQSRFVIGESVMTDYRSDVPLVVYTSQYLQVKYSLWKAGEAKSVALHGNGTLATEEALENAKKFPEKAGLKKYVLYLPELENDEETNLKVELFPPKTPEANFDTQFWSGKFETGQVDGFNFDYWIFHPAVANEQTIEPSAKSDIRHNRTGFENKLVAYNSRLPIVVYAPEGYGINYKIWETNGKMY